MCIFFPHNKQDTTDIAVILVLPRMQAEYTPAGIFQFSHVEELIHQSEVNTQY